MSLGFRKKKLICNYIYEFVSNTVVNSNNRVRTLRMTITFTDKQPARPKLMHIRN